MERWRPLIPSIWLSSVEPASNRCNKQSQITRLIPIVLKIQKNPPCVPEHTNAFKNIECLSVKKMNHPQTHV